MNPLIILAVISIVGISDACHDNGSKFVNETCKDDSECYNGGDKSSIQCKNRVCTCSDGFVGQSQWFEPKKEALVCVNAPFRDQECSTVCQKPYVCSNSSLSDVKTCQCLPPLILKDGFCHAECKSGEIFENGECRKRCSSNENKSGDSGLCKKMAKLGEQCEDKNQCSTPFAQCIKGVCTCGDGFTQTADKNACQSKATICPIGDPVRGRDGKVVECKVVKNQTLVQADKDPLSRFLPSTQQLRDNCGKDQFCMLTSGQGYYAEDATGFCCQRPKFRCPVGSPHPNAVCTSFPLESDAESTPSNQQFCPYGSYSCIQFTFGGGLQTSLCCPVACGSNQILNNGRCYPKREFGDPCEINDQCKGHSGVCEKGVCACNSGYVSEGVLGSNYCRRQCKDNELQADNDRCVPKAKLGDRCDPQVFNQCPQGSYCNNQDNRCDCFCGYVRIGNELCAPQPMCSQAEPTKSQNAFSRASNFTLCKVDPASTNSTIDSALDKCPDGQYCAQYITEYGICCRKPEKPFCYDGSNPGANCDPRTSSTCGKDQFCSRYMNPANGDESIGHVCCPFLIVS